MFCHWSSAPPLLGSSSWAVSSGGEFCFQNWLWGNHHLIKILLHCHLEYRCGWCPWILCPDAKITYEQLEISAADNDRGLSSYSKCYAIKSLMQSPGGWAEVHLVKYHVWLGTQILTSTFFMNSKWKNSFFQKQNTAFCMQGKARGKNKIQAKQPPPHHLLHACTHTQTHVGKFKLGFAWILELCDTMRNLALRTTV